MFKRKNPETKQTRDNENVKTSATSIWTFLNQLVTLVLSLVAIFKNKSEKKEETSEKLKDINLEDNQKLVKESNSIADILKNVNKIIIISVTIPFFLFSLSGCSSMFSSTTISDLPYKMTSIYPFEGVYGNETRIDINGEEIKRNADVRVWILSDDTLGHIIYDAKIEVLKNIN